MAFPIAVFTAYVAVGLLALRFAPARDGNEPAPR